MHIERFYDINLAHASYAIIDEKEIALIDPGRNPQPYYEFAIKHAGKITAVIETHPHADFVSSHLEISKETNAKIYVSKLLGANYPHEPFDDGNEIKLGNFTLRAMNTPGHSPDSISVLLLDENQNEKAVFTGDTLFIGDVGRPDLRENVGNLTSKREALAKQMYESIHSKFSDLQDETEVYPAHGAGSLCGKNLSTDASSTIGKERLENWAFQTKNEQDFIDTILKDQPFIPKYFGYDVDLNKKGAPGFETSVIGVKVLSGIDEIKASALIVDVRDERSFKEGHLEGSFNIMLTERGKFETWLGAIIKPGEEFYLIASSEEEREKAIARAAKIGYEKFILGSIVVTGKELSHQSKKFNQQEFSEDQGKYHILDVRNDGEIRAGKIFEDAITIPLHELRERINEVPKDKPVVVHCAAGYRSAAGSSILERELKDVEVYDLGETIKKFK